MDKIIVVLQAASSELVYTILRTLGTPMFRQGFKFELPGIAIEVAKECSSIHSFWALIITGLLVGHFRLRSFPGKLCLALLVPPIAVFTNAVRIVTIYFLAVKVDMGFMYGRLHHDGGIVFSLISLSALLSFLLIVRKVEHHFASRPMSAS
jgi:exosortase